MIKPDDFNSIDETIDEVNLKKLEAARQAFRDMKKYQDLWAEHGSDRVHEVYDDVEGDWMESFVGGYSTPMTHAERQEWWRSSELGERLGVDVGEAE